MTIGDNAAMQGRAPQLFERAQTGAWPTGPNRCYFCGSPCHGIHSAKDWVKDTFTDFSSCVDTSSQFVCRGCTLAMDEKRIIPGKDKPQKTRNYSWVLTEASVTPYTKGEIPALRSVCLSPPTPPYCIIIAVSGQKQLAFKAMIQTDENSASACLEGETIRWIGDELAQRLELAGAIASVTGKPSLADRPNVGMAIQLYDALGETGVALYEEWERVQDQPLSRLAAFLSPSKKENQE